MKYILQVFIYSSSLQVGIPFLGSLSCCGKHLTSQGNATSHFPNSDFLTCHCLDSFLVRAAFYTVSWERILHNISVSKVSWISSQILKIPSSSCFNKLWYHGTDHFIWWRVFYLLLLTWFVFTATVSSFTLHITSDTSLLPDSLLPVADFSSTYVENSLRFSFDSTSLT